MLNYSDLRLETEICGIKFRNPLIGASGTCNFGQELEQFYPLSTWGGIALKGTTLYPREGNANPRIAETPLGMLNAVGLQNPGIDAFITETLPFLQDKDTVSIANIAGDTIEDMMSVAQKLSGTSVQMIELNISCPNVKQGGMAFGIYPKSVKEVTTAIKSVCSQPLIVKLSPNVADITENAQAAEQGGADALSLINTVSGMAVDPISKKPILSTIHGGLSGPAIKPIALNMVYRVCQAVTIPVIGMGGIMSGTDVVEFLLCGASAVMVGTANIADPLACPHILHELQSFMIEQNVPDIKEWIGALEDYD